MNDGGPAFARPGFECSISDPGKNDTTEQVGMSLRDYFAGQVIIGMAMRRDNPTDAADATLAYMLADAMLAERSKQ